MDDRHSTVEGTGSDTEPKVARGRVRHRLLAIAAVTAVMGFGLPGGVAQPDPAQAHTSCYDFWRQSGHTANVRWYHCHNWTTVDGDDVQTRVHICGYSGTLHGVTVRHHHRDNWFDFWSSTAHAHDYHGEGC